MDFKFIGKWDSYVGLNSQKILYLIINFISMRYALMPVIFLFLIIQKMPAQDTIYVSEDAIIRGAEYSQENFGTQSLLEIKSAPGFPEFTRKAYLKFDLSNWEKEWINSAVLFFYVYNLPSPMQITLSLTTDRWQEGLIIWNNSPGETKAIESTKINGEGKFFSIDITSAFLKEALHDSILSIILSDPTYADVLMKVNSLENFQNQAFIKINSGEEKRVETPQLNSAIYYPDQGIEVSWNDLSGNETGFLVERSQDGEEYIVIDSTDFNIQKYTDANANPGNVYRYRIKALNPFVNSEYSEAIVTDLTARNVPGPVKNFSAQALSSGQILLEWDYQESITGFVIFREEQTGFEILDTIVPGIPSFIDISKNPETIYHYFIQTYNFLGISVPSDTLSITTPGSRNYYFDATNGNDDFPENSKENPWRSLELLNELVFDPGDSVLLKSGESWEGIISLQSSGTEEYPISLGSYGTGSRPVINGKGYEGPVITFKNISYWNVYNLEITNPSSYQACRLGILINASGGKHGHFHLDNLYIHDIFGRYTFDMIGKNTGGIGILGQNDTRFDDILIENCKISDIVRVGIFTNGNTGSRGDRPITNLVIRNNTVNRCAGDGMIIRYADSPLIENNLAIENHNAPEELVQYEVAIWVRSTDEATIQYNRVFDTRGSMDGQAFDADLEAYRTLVQYNYSANNEGGFMLIYGSSQDAIVRYNISQNDGIKGKHILDFPRWVTPRGSGIIHNNVFYIGEDNSAVLVDEALSTAKLYNNIVINRGNGALAIPSDGQTAEFENNCFLGYTSSMSSVNLDPVEGDPDMINPGNGELEFSSLSGYRLTEQSPCLNAGQSISEMNGDYWVMDDIADFWGNPVDLVTPDVGVHQLSGINLIENLPSTNRGLVWEVSPNPFSEDFFLSLKLATPQELTIKIYDIGGKYMDTLFKGKLAKGENTLYYNLSGEKDKTLETGIYLLQVCSPDISMKESKMIIHK